MAMVKIFGTDNCVIKIAATRTRCELLSGDIPFHGHVHIGDVIGFTQDFIIVKYRNTNLAIPRLTDDEVRQLTEVTDKRSVLRQAENRIRQTFGMTFSLSF